MLLSLVSLQTELCFVFIQLIRSRSHMKGASGTFASTRKGTFCNECDVFLFKTLLMNQTGVQQDANSQTLPPSLGPGWGGDRLHGRNHTHHVLVRGVRGDTGRSRCGFRVQLDSPGAGPVPAVQHQCQHAGHDHV